KYIRDELAQTHNDEKRIVNILVEHLYGRVNSSFKDTLWWTYGDILLTNLKVNLKGTKQCESCGDRIEITHRNNRYCGECGVEAEKERQRKKWHKYKNKYRNATVFNT